MKHVLLYTDMAGIYGAEQCTHLLGLALVRAGYRVTVAQPEADHDLIKERQANGIMHRWLAPDNVWDHSRPSRALTDRTDPEGVFDATRPDLVLFSDGGHLSSLTAKEVAADREIPTLVIVHCVTSEWADAFAPHVPRLPAVFAGAAQVVAVSRENLDLLHERFGLPADKGLVIYNGRPNIFFEPRSDTVRQQRREELSIPADAVVCLTVGRFATAKGYQYQLEAFRHLRTSPAWSALFFVWVGDGTHELRVRHLVRLMGADDRVRFPGPRADVAALLDAADLFVLPSQFEGMPLAVLEAMAKGLPVVTTAVSGIPEALGDTGCVLPDPRQDPTVPARLAAAISALALDAPRRRALGRAAHDRARTHFHERTMTERYLGLIERTLSGAQAMTSAP